LELAAGQCYIQKSFASLIGAKKGDIIYLVINANSYFEDMWRVRVINTELMWNYLWNLVYLPVKVMDTLDGPQGKTAIYAKHTVIMEYNGFLAYLAQHIHPEISSSAIDSLKSTDLQEYALQILWNFPPPRVEIYSGNNNDRIK
jgi:hypothetical protein